jgi:hypothetical protein
MASITVGFCTFPIPNFVFALPTFSFKLPGLPSLLVSVDLSCPLN